MSIVVVDTNVPVVANAQAPQASIECQLRCVDELQRVRKGDRVAVDEDGVIFGQYQRRLAHSGQPGVGDAFFKWLWDNQGNTFHCLRIKLSPIPGSERLYSEFPDDPDLRGFDPSDRVFVAVALASGTNTPILNAADTDWWLFRQVLERNGVTVQFLCPELMVRG